MATNKKLTNAATLRIALTAFNRAMDYAIQYTGSPESDAINETVFAAIESSGFSIAEFSDKLTHMVEMAEKPKTPKAPIPSKAALENDKLLRELVEKMSCYNGAVGTTWIQEHVKGIMTPQKATAVCREGVKRGVIVRAGKEKGKMTYTLTPTE